MESVAPSTATRRHALLLGFMTLSEVDAFFAQLPIVPAESGAVPADLWRTSRDERTRLGAFEPGSVDPLPAGLQGLVDEMRGREAFAKYYASQAEYEFALAPIDNLLTPQVQADTEYVSELAATLAREREPEADFRFAFPVASVTEPMITGQTVIFSSFGPGITANAVPTVTRRADGTYDIVVRATSRPNYVQVARYDGRLILVNGVHKVLALRGAGRSHAACLVRSIERREDLAFVQNLSMHSDANYRSVRPALVRDFVSPVAVPVLWRATYTILRVIVQVDQLAAPAIASPGGH